MINDNVKEAINKFLNNRPGVIAAYGYGSGIIKQSGYSDNDKPQIDLILVVDNLKEWHLENIQRNSKDYSMIGSFYFKNTDNELLKGSTGITYLSNIEEDDNTFKYGTIERLDLQNHLYYWDSFYMPGRFQKVVYPIKDTDGLEEAIKTNRENALMITSYLLNKEKTTKKELLNVLCSLSYLGDTRMKIAENPKKVENIVNASYKELNSIYNFNTAYMKEIPNDKVLVDLKNLKYQLSYFPLSLRNYLNNDLNPDAIIDYIMYLNKSESIEQTLKGLKTNGVVKSVDYASKKLAKRFKR